MSGSSQACSAVSSGTGSPTNAVPAESSRDAQSRAGGRGRSRPTSTTGSCRRRPRRGWDRWSRHYGLADHRLRGGLELPIRGGCGTGADALTPTASVPSGEVQDPLPIAHSDCRRPRPARPCPGREHRENTHGLGPRLPVGRDSHRNVRATLREVSEYSSPQVTTYGSGLSRRRCATSLKAGRGTE